MTRYRATLAYDGTDYHGFQRQANGIITIQLAVEEAVRAVTHQHVGIMGAGRTDTGVHARGQVIAFEADWRHGDMSLLKAINSNLPYDITLQDIRQHEGFHPRFDALSRVYRYSVIHAEQDQPLLRRYTWRTHRELDLGYMQQAADLLPGKHDFASFGNPPRGTNTVRDVMVSQWVRQEQPYGALLVYTIEATAFLQHMVRRVVGMLVDVGRGALTVAEFEQIFRSADLSRAKTVAPPQGLVLEKVRYPDEHINNVINASQNR